MLADTVRTVQPSHVLQLQSPVYNRNLPHTGWWKPPGDPEGGESAHTHILLPAYEATGDSTQFPSNTTEPRGGEPFFSAVQHRSNRTPVVRGRRYMAFTNIKSSCYLCAGVNIHSRIRSPVEARILSWTAFANTCLLEKQAVLTAASDATNLSDVAQALAGELPFVIALKSLQIEVRL